MAECLLGKIEPPREQPTSRHAPTLKAEYCRGYTEGYQDGEAGAILSILDIVDEDTRGRIERHFGIADEDEQANAQ